MDTTNRKGMEKLYLKRLFILFISVPSQPLGTRRTIGNSCQEHGHRSHQ